MIWTKACPRCDGDLVMESDKWGRYISCIHCGFTRFRLISEETLRRARENSVLQFPLHRTSAGHSPAR
jgi:DNA-directed RNA polymerase subunit RPC12/RpoP